jgi:putative hydrolase of the HAD superfamily
VTVVWCDFGGVLTEPIPEVLARVSVSCAISVPDLLGAFSAVAAEFGGTLLEPLENGWLTEREWGSRVLTHLPRPPARDLTRFSALWYADRRFNTDLFDALARLRGVRLAMLTNSVREWEPYREALIPDPGVFGTVIRSHEVGVGKPDPRIYALAEQAVSAPAADCLLIDDSAANCAAARARGWRAVHHHDTATTLDELDRLLTG